MNKYSVVNLRTSVPPSAFKFVAEGKRPNAGSGGAVPATGNIVVKALAPSGTYAPPNIRKASADWQTLAHNSMHSLANFRLRKIIDQIHKLGLLPDEWKGPGSVAPKNRTVHDAQAFAKMLYADPTVANPIISAASDGEINFYWKNPQGKVDLGFFGDGTYSYYAEFNNGPELSEEGVSVDTLPSGTLLSLIRL